MKKYIFSIVRDRDKYIVYADSLKEAYAIVERIFCGLPTVRSVQLINATI